MQFLAILLIICYFSSNSNFFELHTFCFAQYDRIGNTFEQIRDASFYKKPDQKYPERIGSYGEEQSSGKGFFSKQSTDNSDPSSERKLPSSSNNQQLQQQ
ncbi:hypothetical protein QQG55_0680 [Brugia pahangi]